MKHKINTQKVKNLLDKQKKSNAELARKTGLETPAISSAFKGKRNLPLAYFISIANFLNVEPLSLLQIDDTPKKNNVQGNL